jgi:dihydrofolate reductase
VTGDQQLVTSNSQGPKPRISIIVAMAKNRVIGKDNKLPWHLSADLKRFKALTMGHHIIMGRKTFESIGKILPGRKSVIVTRNPEFRFEGIVTAGNLQEALEKSSDDTEVFVIGGEEIFREAQILATRIHATEIAREYTGDRKFPAIDCSTWRETNSETFSEGDIRGRFVTYDRTSTD